MEFNYYYGSQADQFSFIRIPKLMLTGNMFASLSIPAKVLYGVLLDRMSLSMKNGWFDEENRVFIIYQIGEIQEDLGFTKKKAMDLLSELETFGLLEKKRRGHGLPNILYIKSFLSGNETKGSDLGTSGYQGAGSRGAYSDTSISVHFGTCEDTEKALQEVPVLEPLKNNTEINNTYRSDTKSYPIISVKGDTKRYEDENSITRAYEKLIRENIAFDDLLTTHEHDHELLNGILDLILETLVSRQEYILIASDRYPAELVKSKLLKLNYSHIDFVLHCFHSNTTKVRNIKKYLLATLFNAPSTMSGYYRAEVNHDIPELAAIQ